MNKQERLHQVALVMVKGIGYMLFKQLIAQLGSAQNVFSATQGDLLKVPGIGGQAAYEMLKKTP